MAEKKIASRVGFRNLVYCLVNKDTAPTAGATGEYETGEVKKLAGAINAELSNQASDPDIQYFDDEEGDVLYPDPKITITLELADLPPEEAAIMVGGVVDKNGVAIDRAGDKPPYIALGFESRKANGEDRYVWLYKCRAFISSETYHTKEGETLTRQSDKIEVTAVKRNKDDAWRAKVDTDNEAFALVKETFFDKPYEPDYAT